jgi:methylmalonyl-CoA mutase C-terminal domain/subunit
LTPPNTPQPPIRILLCKSGLEEHDRGVRYVARKLVEAGMEVVYVVFHHPEEVVTAAVDEDVDVVGVSSSAGGHVAVVSTIRRGLDQHDMHSARIVVGGIIPTRDHDALRELGVIGVFGPGSAPQQITEAIEDAVRNGRATATNA